MISRRTVLGGVAGLAATGVSPAWADTPGVTPAEIKIGNTMPYSGPMSAYGVAGTLEATFFRVINDAGGIAGRKIRFISYDDGYSPPKSLEQVRRLIEVDQVAFLFSTLGTPTNSAFVGYVNGKRVPHLFLSTGADKWGDYKQYPWTMGFQPSYRTEAQIYAKHILENMPDPKVAILYQNGDFGYLLIPPHRTVLGEPDGSCLT
jgi:branched-chain amino acid transport system substrate-binding protein